MTPAEFKKKWSRAQGKESAIYQEHFVDLCRMVSQATPSEADPSGGDFFCFQKRVVKDAELFDIATPDSAEPGERGFADVWKKGCFAWEYKGKKKDLDEAYKQLLRYRESLLNPPLLIVSDFDRYIIRTNFNGTVQEVYQFTNDQIDRPENLRVLRCAFENPDFFKPQRTTAQVTQELAGQIAEIARMLQQRESVELSDAKTRKELVVAQKKNLRIARFLNRIVFCLFAEDTGLLPSKIFTEITKTGIEDPHFFAERMEELFRVMAKGGSFGSHKIRYFNGHLFEEGTVFELTEEEIRKLAAAAEADWQFIAPSIMGTLFERALDENQRAQLGAHYTSEADIKTLVEPVLMQPLRREWSKLKGELAAAYVKGKSNTAQRASLTHFQQKLSTITVLDPACGSGNFLYVSMQLLLDMEKELITFATQLGFTLKARVSVQQLKAIEINPYAYELAQVSVQIGYLQWRRDNGFDNDRTPVLQNLDGFENKDALLHETFRKKPKDLKAARDEEHQGQNEFSKVYLERAWPECDVVVGNPPFLGNSFLRKELTDAYVDGLYDCFKGRIPHGSDLCCYWFEKARDLIESKKCKRAGLLATQGIRGGANRAVLKRIKETCSIFFARSDAEWVLAGANVHVSMVGFDSGTEANKSLDGDAVSWINANLTTDIDVTEAKPLRENAHICFMGPSPKAPFDIAEDAAIEMLVDSVNAFPSSNSDVIRPVESAIDLAQRNRRVWTLDFDSLAYASAVRYEHPFKFVKERIYPIRSTNLRQTNSNWWQYERPRIDMRKAMVGLPRFIVTPGVAKHRLYVWRAPEILCNQGTLVFARTDDYSFGVIHSRFHEVWALAQGTQLREKESGFRYTPTTCFETFPFPFADDLRVREESMSGSGWEAVMENRFYTLREESPACNVEGSPKQTPRESRARIADAAKELNDLRERWLNPPEWTVEKVLTFPGSLNGPWARYVVNPDKNGIGTVLYPRLEPRDPECAAKLKRRTLTNLYNERPAWLDLAHKTLDAAVADAYGWPTDLTDDLILTRLLKLNQERAAEESKAPEKEKRTSREKHPDEML